MSDKATSWLWGMKVGQLIVRMTMAEGRGLQVQG
jgi:hypothetical protein